jgi:hypothetical protein
LLKGKAAFGMPLKAAFPFVKAKELNIQETVQLFPGELQQLARE